jgi:hypothetical protein
MQTTTDKEIFNKDWTLKPSWKVDKGGYDEFTFTKKDGTQYTSGHLAQKRFGAPQKYLGQGFPCSRPSLRHVESPFKE